jgi:ABC-2 type transport system ATP-binding protein
VVGGWGYSLIHFSVRLVAAFNLEFILIAFENLEVRYAATAAPALKGLSLSLDRGIVGLLGPNGAGKSTLLKALLGLLTPSGGSGSVLGVALGAPEAAKLRSRIGYMPEYDALIEDASAYEQVAFWGELSGLAPEASRDRAHEVLYFVGLDESRYRPVSGYSTGMRQRVKLAQALVHSPELIFLDEPTNGLDPDGRRRMLDLVLRVHAELGTGVILASHLLGDVERVADQLIILDQGEIKAAGSMAGLRKALAKRVELRFLDPLEPAQEAALAELGTVLEARNGLYDLELLEADPAGAFRWAQSRGATLVQLTPRHDRLDEVLLRALHPATGA